MPSNKSPKPSKPFKEFIDADAVARLAGWLVAARPDWDPAPFQEAANEGLGALELKARVLHVAAALQAHLDPDYPTALAHLLDALPPGLQSTEDLAVDFAAWPICGFVREYGLDDFERSMAAMPALTRRFSAEFAVRPYLEQDPERALEILTAWAEDPDPHLRRLASEGSRPRLPWGRALRRFQKDPTETLALLEILRDDPVRYVQRSVANHLNDVSKDHPDRAVAVARRWSIDAPPGRAWIVRHALRSLVKQGHRGALEVLGYGAPQVQVEGLALAASAVRMGGAISFSLTLRSTSQAEQRLVLDYAVHHKKADGSLRPKVFKWTQRTLPAGGAVELSRAHRFRPITTRRYYPGAHRIELLINGRSSGSLDFTLEIPEPSDA